MPGDIDREQVQRLVADGALLIEVLPREEYLEWHLPGAVHMPLRKLEAEARATLDPVRPIVVYCWDSA